MYQIKWWELKETSCLVLVYNCLEHGGAPSWAVVTAAGKGLHFHAALAAHIETMGSHKVWCYVAMIGGHGVRCLKAHIPYYPSFLSPDHPGRFSCPLSVLLLGATIYWSSAAVDWLHLDLISSLESSKSSTAGQLIGNVFVTLAEMWIPKERPFSSNEEDGTWHVLSFRTVCWACRLSFF